MKNSITLELPSDWTYIITLYAFLDWVIRKNGGVGINEPNILDLSNNDFAQYYNEFIKIHTRGDTESKGS
jgi:hypothetical protein